LAFIDFDAFTGRSEEEQLLRNISGNRAIGEGHKNAIRRIGFNLEDADAGAGAVPCRPFSIQAHFQ
jgi:hypothetical protein